MRGLVLEGGGAKGAYHVGAIKALYDNGYTFDGVAGTSIGAINGAMIAQDNDYEACLDMWTNVKPSDFLEIDDIETVKLFSHKNDLETFKKWLSLAIFTVKNLGVPTDKVIPFLKRYIDEDKLRSCGRDFAIITVCVSDKKHLELHLEDIPYGQLHEFIFASAYFPLFRMGKIQGKYYLDGGLYDNLPINALLSRNKYDEIIAIRTGSKMPRKPVIDPDVVIKVIEPNEFLGNIAALEVKRIAYNIKLGYYDALRMINKYKGITFYFENLEYPQIDDLLHSLKQEEIDKIAGLLKLKVNTCNEEVINAVYYYSKKDNITLSNEQGFLAFLEKYALIYGVDKFRIYNLKEFLKELKTMYLLHQNNTSEVIKPITKKSKLNELFDIIINDIVKEE